MPAQTIIKLRRDTAANWTSVDPTLGSGELGIESDTNRMKIGDGTTAWSAIDYFGVLDSIDDIAGVLITSAATGEILKYDGTNWVNGTVDFTGYATETYVDTAESDAVTASNTYTDDLIGDATVDGTAGNTVSDRITSEVAGLVDSAPAALDTLNELAAALGDDANFATTVTNQITNGDSATLTSAQQYADSGDSSTLTSANNYSDSLAVNYDPAGSAATAETNANNYTDAEISSLDTSLKSYADQAEADAVTTANNYTDAAVSNLVDSAPGTLDTLNEIAAALNDDANAFTTLSNQITTAEANANTYTDNKVANIIHPFSMLGGM